MKATLNFNEYFIIETHYINNPFTGNTEKDISPTFEYDIQHKQENKNDAGIYLTVTIGDIDEDYYISAQILGVFTMDEDNDLSLEAKEKMYRVNAVAILFPYIRSLVSDLTGKGREEDHIILPPLNIQAMLSDKPDTIESDDTTSDINVTDESE